jgi:HNH endonuclease
MNRHHARVALRAGYRCEYCRAPEVAYNFAFEVEHITPQAHEGRSVDENFALACQSCNLHKATHTTAVDPEIQAVVRLFNPRSDAWTEHFRASRESLMIIGLTAIGRATIVQLKMNSEFQLAARRQWRSLGLFP